MLIIILEPPVHSITCHVRWEIDALIKFSAYLVLLRGLPAGIALSACARRADMSMLSLNMTLGAVQLCAFVSAAAFGVILNQAVTYFSKFPNDRLLFKLSSGICLVLCVADTSLGIMWSYRWTVLSYGDLSVMARAPHELPAAIIVGSFCTLVVQSFFAYRVYLISQKKYWIPSLITICSLLQFGAMLYVAPLCVRHPSFLDLEVSIFPMAWIWLGSAMAADLTITASMVYYLHFKRRRAVVKSSQGLFHKIISRCIQTNILSLISQIIVLLLFKHRQTGFWWVLTLFTTNKTLSFSLIGSLNARRSSQTEIDHLDAPPEPIDPRDVRPRSAPGPRVHKIMRSGTTSPSNGKIVSQISNVSVHVEQEVQIDVEKGDEKWIPTLRQLKPLTVALPPHGLSDLTFMPEWERIAENRGTKQSSLPLG